MSSLFETVGILKLRFRTGNRKAAYKKVSFLQKHPFWWNLAFFFRKSLYQKCSNRSIICWPTSIFSPWMDFVSFVHMNKQSDERENHLWYGIRVLAEPTRGLGSQGIGPRASLFSAHPGWPVLNPTTDFLSTSGITAWHRLPWGNILSSVCSALNTSQWKWCFHQWD